MEQVEQTDRVSFTKAQQRKLQELNRELQNAQREFNSYINYLVDEYEIEPNENWRVTPTFSAFERAHVRHPEANGVPILAPNEQVEGAPL